MKIVHVSDIHINAEPIFGLDPADNFRKCLKQVEGHQTDADRVIITGDMTHHGLAASYEKLKEFLAASSRSDHAMRPIIGTAVRRGNY